MKKVLLISILTLLLFTITGCGNNKEKEESCCECKDCPMCDVCCDCDDPYLNK